jgi:hypothetical protein
MARAFLSFTKGDIQVYINDQDMALQTIKMLIEGIVDHCNNYIDYGKNSDDYSKRKLDSRRWHKSVGSWQWWHKKDVQEELTERRRNDTGGNKQATVLEESPADLQKKSDKAHETTEGGDNEATIPEEREADPLNEDCKETSGQEEKESETETKSGETDRTSIKKDKNGDKEEKSGQAEESSDDNGKEGEVASKAVEQIDYWIEVKAKFGRDKAIMKRIYGYQDSRGYKHFNRELYEWALKKFGKGDG